MSVTAVSPWEEELQGLNPDWWYFKGNAYDFTSFLDKHPGGSHALMTAKGRECTALFNSYHTRLPSEEILRKYRVPSDTVTKFPLTIKTEYDPFTFKSNGFYFTVKERALHYFKSNGYDHTKGTLLDQFWWVVNSAVLLLCAYLAFFKGSPLAAIVFGISKSLLVIRSTHAASHYSFSTNSGVNRFIYWLNMCCCGDTPAQWTAKHVLAHHVDTNIVPQDDDSMYPIKRVLKSFPRCWWHSYQHIYIWFLYSFVYYPWTLSHNIKLILGYFYGRVFEGAVEVRHHSALDWSESVSCIVVHHTTRLLPFIFLPTWGSAFVIAVIAEFSGSVWFSLQFAVNHETPEAVALSTGFAKLANDKRDWGAHQLMTSHNYSIDFLPALHLSGGLNYQIEHHLFPSVHYKYYPQLSWIVRKTAVEFGLPYNASSSFFEGVSKHYQLLKHMGQND